MKAAICFKLEDAALKTNFHYRSKYHLKLVLEKKPPREIYVDPKHASNPDLRLFWWKQRLAQSRAGCCKEMPEIHSEDLKPRLAASASPRAKGLLNRARWQKF